MEARLVEKDETLGTDGRNELRGEARAAELLDSSALAVDAGGGSLDEAKEKIASALHFGAHAIERSVGIEEHHQGGARSDRSGTSTQSSAERRGEVLRRCP